MTLDPKVKLRLQFLVRVIRKECRHLIATDQRLFKARFGAENVSQLETDPDLAERVEAFVSRFCRLQDTIGDKLLPALLLALGETPAAAIDNLDRAERLGLIESADDWLVMRSLRNQMVHEYVEDPIVFANALQSGHGFVQTLAHTVDCVLAEIGKRGWE